MDVHEIMNFSHGRTCIS